jgi:hypothetical protein
MIRQIRHIRQWMASVATLPKTVHDLRSGLETSDSFLKQCFDKLERRCAATFVCAMVDAEESSDRSRTRWTMGDSRTLDADQPNTTIVLSPQVPLARARIFVFTDVSRVHVEGFYRHQQMHAAPGSCPIFYAEDEWPIAAPFKILCTLRKEFRR